MLMKQDIEPAVNGGGPHANLVPGQPFADGGRSVVEPWAGPPDDQACHNHSEHRCNQVRSSSYPDGTGFATMQALPIGQSISLAPPNAAALLTGQPAHKHSQDHHPKTTTRGITIPPR
jgi:hypothetical protein